MQGTTSMQWFLLTALEQSGHIDCFLGEGGGAFILQSLLSDDISKISVCGSMHLFFSTETLGFAVPLSKNMNYFMYLFFLLCVSF